MGDLSTLEGKNPVFVLVVVFVVVGGRTNLDPSSRLPLLQSPVLLHVVQDVSVFRVLQHHVNFGLVFEIAIHPDDVGMLQLGPNFQFSGKELLLEIFGGFGSVDDFEGVLFGGRRTTNSDGDFDFGITSGTHSLLAQIPFVRQNSFVRGSDGQNRRRRGCFGSLGSCVRFRGRKPDSGHGAGLRA